MQHINDTDEIIKTGAGGQAKGQGYMTRQQMAAAMLEGLQQRKREAQNHVSASMQGRGQQSVTSIPTYRLAPLMRRIDDLQTITGDKPQYWQKPGFGNIDYIIAQRMGWISLEEEEGDRLDYEKRRERSLNTCHRYNTRQLFHDEIVSPKPAPEAGEGFVPHASSRVLSDVNLTDGSRRMAFKLLEKTYRANREGRWLKITVTYLSKSLNRCRRTIQNYLRLLEALGYIRVHVILGDSTRMCVGLAIELLEPLFANHHRKKWPQKRENSDVQTDSLKYWNKYKNIGELMLTSIDHWSEKCMQGVFRTFMKSKTPLPAIPS